MINPKDSDIYIQTERAYDGLHRGESRYSIYVHGDFVICDASREDLQDLARCIQHVLDDTEKGGEG